MGVKLLLPLLPTAAALCLTLPSVTVCSVLMSETWVPLSGVASRYPMACRTKAWTTCSTKHTTPDHQSKMLP